MKHVGYTYKILDGLEKLEGKNIIEVLRLDPETHNNSVTAIITNSTILLIGKGEEGIPLNKFDDVYIDELTKQTGILKSQLI